MLVLLEQLFTQSQKLQSQGIRTSQDEKPVLYLEHMSKDTLDVAKSHLDWMNFKGSFQDMDDNPFAFKNVKCLSNMEELSTELENNKPRVIVTSSASFDLGFARKHLKDFAKFETNMIIFTEMETLNSKCIAHKLLNGDKSLLDHSFHRIKNSENEQMNGIIGNDTIPEVR